MTSSSDDNSPSLEAPGTASSDLAEMLNSATCRVRDLEDRLTKVMEQQLEVREALLLIQDPPPDPAPTSVSDERQKSGLGPSFPADHTLKAELLTAVNGMIREQKAWIDEVKRKMHTNTSFRDGPRVFKEIERHLSERLHFLEESRALIEGPFYDPPPPPLVIEEEHHEEDDHKKKGKGKGKGKKH